MMKFFIFFMILLFLLVLIGGKNNKIFNLKSDKNKIIIPKIINSINVEDYLREILPYFKELENIEIVAEKAKIETTLAVRPSFALKNIFKRKYIVYVNDDINFDGMYFKTLPEEAKIGILAHELCHISEYTKMNNFQLMIYGIKYLSKRGKMNIEKFTDSLVVKKGFGTYLKAWAEFAMFTGPASQSYKNFKKEYYLNPDEIDILINSKIKSEENEY